MLRCSSRWSSSTEEVGVGLVVGGLGAREAGPVDPVVDETVDRVRDLLDLVAQVLGVEVGSTFSVEGAPLGLEVEVHLLEVVGDDGSGGDLDDRGHRDAARVVGVAREVGVLDARDAEHGVEAVGVEVEGPAALVVGRAADPHREGVLEAEQAPHDDRAVRPRAGAGHDEPVAVGLDGKPLGAVGSDPRRDVARVAVEGLLDVRGLVIHISTITSGCRLVGVAGGVRTPPGGRPAARPRGGRDRMAAWMVRRSGDGVAVPTSGC